MRTPVSWLGFVAFILALSPFQPATAETLTGRLRFRDHIPGTTPPVPSSLRPIQHCKVEVWVFRPRLFGVWDWGLDTTVTTDAAGDLNVAMPFRGSGVRYSLRIFAENYGAAVWPVFVSTIPFWEEPGKPDGAAIIRTVAGAGDVLDFSYNFEHPDWARYWSLADAARRGFDYVAARRDPGETDPLPRVGVQPGALLTFYNPVNFTLTIHDTHTWEDQTIVHEFAHYVEHRIGSFVPIASTHTGCTTRDGLGNLINSAEHAWMEGFAEFFAQAVVADNPPGTLLSSGNGTFTVNDLEDAPWASCSLPAWVTPPMIENVVAGVLWDAFDPVGACGTPEAHDTLENFGTQIIQIVDRELDLPRGPTILDFFDAWVGRGLPAEPMLEIFRHHGLAAPVTPALTCPADITVTAQGNDCGAVVTFPLPTLTPANRCASLHATTPSGSRFPIGTTPVTISALANGQNIARCTFNVVVLPNPALPNPGGTGLLGVYYDNPDFTEPRVSRTEAIDFSWGLDAPAAGMGPDTFSVRWSGKIVPRYTGRYRFYAVTDDGMRLLIDGQPLMYYWFDQPPTEHSASIDLVGGVAYDIVYEMYENGGGATARLFWESDCQPREIVPVSQLIPAALEDPTPDRPTFVADFRTAVPSGLTLFGDAAMSEGWLKLTTPQNSYGIAYVANFSGSRPVSGFEATFRTAIFGSTCCGGGTLPADGFSFNLVPAATVLANPGYGQPAEEGLDQGLAVNFDTWDNGGSEGPAIEVKWLGQLIARRAYQVSLSPIGVTTARAAARDVRIELSADGRLTVVYAGDRVLDHVQTPYSPAAIGTPQWVIGARNGGANDNHWIGNLRIVVNRAPIPALYSTGVNDLGWPLNDNVYDSHYVIAGGFFQILPPAARASGGYPIGPWVGDNEASAWIGPTIDTMGGPESDSTYVTGFDLRGLDPSTATIQGWFAVDDQLLDVRLNGVSTGIRSAAGPGSGPYTTWQAFKIAGGFQPGSNTLAFVVHNGPGGNNPTGLRVQLYGWGTPPAQLKLGLFRGARGSTTLQWGALPHKLYHVERADSPAGPWVRNPPPGLRFDSYFAQVFELNRTPSRQFYRVIEEP